MDNVGTHVTTAPVKIIECPRDAWQGMPGHIPAEVKATYLRALITAGFKHIDAASFVSPAAVPQMADAESVLALLDPPDDVEIIAIVVNQQGVERALRTEAVRTLGFPYSVSETFLARNQRQTRQEALRLLGAIVEQAKHAAMGVVAYLSMSFGNPYGDPWSIEDVITACRGLRELGIDDISLADTVGVASPADISAVLQAVTAEFPRSSIGAHLHSVPAQSPAKVASAYQAGCRRLDTALGGQGGCPFAQDALVGNLPTEAALVELQRQGATLPSLLPLDELLAMGRTIAGKFGAAK